MFPRIKYRKHLIILLLASLCILYLVDMRSQSSKVIERRVVVKNSNEDIYPLLPLNFYPKSVESDNVNIEKQIEQTAGVHSYNFFVGLQHTDNTIIINPNNERPIILIWAPQFGAKIEYLANPDVCGGTVDCQITYDKELLDKSGALVFHFGSSKSSMPPRRRPEQLYAWWTLEKNHGSKMLEFDNFFNLTITYRRDSGIYAPYGSINLILRELREAKETDLEALLAKKRESEKVAAWAVSNCGVSHRMELAKKLMNAGLGVDTYGRCFGGRQIGQGAYSKSFYEALSRYKFYFAFENGYHCRDYMTEKFWFNGLRSGAVPIVWGPKKEDVVAVAPSHSFIHVEDFSTAEELVNYLNYLVQNETAYREYLSWREWANNPDLIEERLRVKNRDNDLRSFCKLCRILQEEEYVIRNGGQRRNMVVPSMNRWWWDEENQECLSGPVIPLK